MPRPAGQRRADREHRRRSRRVVVGAEVDSVRPLPCPPASCRCRRGPDGRSARRAPPRASPRWRSAPSRAGSRRRCGRSASRGRRRCEGDREIRATAKPVTCGFAASSDCCAATSVLSGAAAKSASATFAADARRDDAGTGDRGVEAHRDRLARVRRSRAGDDEHRLRAALTRGHRLVAKVRSTARESPSSSVPRPRGSSAARGRPCP